MWYIQTNYGYGWEDESEYDNRADAKADLAEYKVHMIHYNGSVRLVHRREKIA
jgi:hypothetical protein